MEHSTGIPLGLKLILPERFRSLNTYRVLVLVLTFIAYTSYHLSRRPFSIVKNVLNRNCTELDPLPHGNSTTWCDWEPFDEPNANTLLATLDSSFLGAYAIGMFVSGFLADRCNLRFFLSFGMLFSGLFTYGLGLAYYYDVHTIEYFIVLQVISGFFQTTGWPAVVACVGHWFPKSSRGVIFGVWNSHTNVGNILGAIIAGAFVEYNWGLSFIVPGFIMAIAGFIVFLFLTPYPEDVGISQASIHDPIRRKISQDFTESDDVGSSGVSSMVESRGHTGYQSEIIDHNSEEDSPLLGDERPINLSGSQKSAISFWNALRIPGVVEFSICLFFAKFVSYTFLYWLPRIIMSLSHESSSNSAYLSVPFDLGGIIGGIFAGYVVDRTGASAITCVVMLLFAIPSLYIYLLFGASSYFMNVFLQIVAGTFVNGPYALITTAVSAELGTKVKSRNALATVTAIIDGTGSLGAAVGPFFAGLVSSTNGWNNVFFMVMIADGIALLSLLRIAKTELVRIKNRGVHPVNV